MSKNLYLIALVLLGLIATASCHGHHNHDHDHDHHHDHDHDHDHEHHDHDHHDHEHHGHEESKYETVNNVLILTDSTLEEAIFEFPNILVKFFAPWCGHCKHMTAAYIQLATDLATQSDSPYKIAEVDCTVQRMACNKHGIQGYPTLKYFIDGVPHQYSGERSREAMGTWLGSKATEVRATKAAEEL